MLATSNGRGGGKWDSFGSTSYGSANSGLGVTAMLASAVFTGILTILGAVVVLGNVWP